MRILGTLPFVLGAACAGDPSAIYVELSPSVISSLDGTTTVTALISDGARPLADTKVSISTEYTDRNGAPHEVAPIEGTTDTRGVLSATLEGLAWDGVGTVTVAAGGIDDSASFSVLDRTPPKIEILPPTTDLRVGPGLPLDVQVRVTDEIGVSEVTLDTNGVLQGGTRSTVVSSGAGDTTLTFRTSVPTDAAPGPTIELHALAADLSGNYGAAAALTLTVDPAIVIATPPGLGGGLVVTGSAQQLVNPRSLVVSPKDGHIYVADQAATGACNPSCIWRVDAVSGAIDAAPALVGVGQLEGLALDATGDNLYYTDRQNRTGRLTWNGAAYATPAACSDPAQQRPQDGYHLVADPTLGLLVTDDNSTELVRVATCAPTSVGAGFSMNASFDRPQGIALGAAGEIYVSDVGRGRISRVDRTTGAVAPYEAGVNEPYGLEWMAGTTSWAGSLMVADFGDRTVVSTRGTGTLAAAYLRNPPVDLAVAGGTLYILTAPSAGNRGRIYKVAGF
jgi:DNA-binding beta-propeller fold protein YncE